MQFINKVNKQNKHISIVNTIMYKVNKVFVKYIYIHSYMYSMDVCMYIRTNKYYF